MADIQDIQQRACENGFSCLTPKQAAKVEIALWRRLTGNTETFDELMLRARNNGFMAVAQNPKLWTKLYVSFLNEAYN